MRKLISLLIVLGVLFVALPAMAGSHNYYHSDTYGPADASYSVADPSYADGRASAFGGDGYAHDGDFYLNGTDSTLRGGYSSQWVQSHADITGAHGKTWASGDASQYTELGVKRDGQFVYGGEESHAGYEIRNNGTDVYSHGDAKTTGGIIGGVYTEGGWHSLSLTGGAVGSYGVVNANKWSAPDYRRSVVEGSGGVEAGSSADKGSGWAGTYGSAEYSYRTVSNSNYTTSGGFAYTRGRSEVSSNWAKAASTSYSSTGSGVYTEGGASIGH